MFELVTPQQMHLIQFLILPQTRKGQSRCSLSQNLNRVYLLLVRMYSHADMEAPLSPIKFQLYPLQSSLLWKSSHAEHQQLSETWTNTFRSQRTEARMQSSMVRSSVCDSCTSVSSMFFTATWYSNVKEKLVWNFICSKR